MPHQNVAERGVPTRAPDPDDSEMKKVLSAFYYCVYIRAFSFCTKLILILTISERKKSLKPL